MKASVLAATIAGGAVLGAAVFVPFGGQSMVAEALKVPAADQKIEGPQDQPQELLPDAEGSQGSESTNPNAGAAGIDPTTGGTASGTSFNFSGGDDDDDDEDDDHEDREDDEDGHDDEDDD
jgi:hypothetical protein